MVLVIVLKSVQIEGGPHQGPVLMAMVFAAYVSHRFIVCCLYYYFFQIYNGILLPKLFWPTVRKNCSSDWEKKLKLEAEGWEFAKFLRSLPRTIYSNSDRSAQFLI